MELEPSLQSSFGEHAHAQMVAQIRDFAVFFIDKQGHIASWNEGARLLFGYEPEEIIGQPSDILFVLEDREAGVPQQELDGAVAEGRVEDMRWHQKKDSSRFWCNGVTTALVDEEGDVQGFGKIARDDTQRKQTEAEREELMLRLAFERERLSAIFQTTPAFVAVLRGEEHVFEMSNPRYYQLVGHRDIIGKPLLEALPEIEGQGFFELLSAVLHTGEPFEGSEIPVKLQREPNGPIEERLVDLLYLPLREADGSISGVFSHGVDVTNQARLRHEAQEANRLKDEFLATLSHELRTPLNAILGWANLLQSGQLSPEDSQRGLVTIERNARAQAQLIEDILDVSRMITGTMRLNVQPVDLTKVIEEAVSTALPAAQAKEIRLQRILDAGAVVVGGDAARLQQIVWNLLSNAIKFTPSGGRVQIQLERLPSHVELTVTDTGIGITPDMLPHIFDRFRQADSSSTRAHGGLGLGLAIVRHLVELHGGAIEASSVGVGQGSVFTLKLPLNVGAYEVPEEAPRAHPSISDPIEDEEYPSLEGLHVLLVDDQDDARLLLSVLLEKCGARVTAVMSVREALTVFENSSPDVLLSDIGMPGEDGYSLIKRVRDLSTEQGGRTAAIALTAFARPEDRAKALEAGFQKHISKPVAPLELVTTIADLAANAKGGSSA